MRTISPDDRGRISLGKSVTHGETYAVEEADGEIRLVRLVKPEMKNKRLNLEALSRRELLDLVRLAKLPKAELANQIRTARRRQPTKEPVPTSAARSDS